MRSNILTPEQRIEIANQLFISHDRPTLRRVVKANDLHVRDYVSRYNGHHTVKSQTYPDKVYHVYLSVHSGCTCKDWHKANLRTPAHVPAVSHECKHILAAKLYESEVRS